MSGKYDAYLDHPRHVSPTRAPMSLYNRAAQFAPFAALTGYGDEIDEAGRLTETKTDPDESVKAELDRKLREILEREDRRITLTWFRKDPLKEGGAYVTYSGNIKKADPLERILLMTDGTVIPLDDVVRIMED